MNLPQDYASQYTTASFPEASIVYSEKQSRMSDGMKSDWTPTRKARVISTILASLVALGSFLAVGPSLSAQQQRPTTAAKSNEALTQREYIASLLREAASLLQTGKLDEAEPLVRRAVAAAPSNADAHNLLGVILDQRGNLPEAEHEYRTALRLNPKGVSATANLGVLLARSKRDDEAIKTFEIVLRLAPGHPQATINLGLLYASRKDYQHAADLLARANELQPHTYDILYHLGIAFLNLQLL